MPRTPADDERKTLSMLLTELSRGAGETLRVDEVVDRFGRRAFGGLLFIFAVPNLLPLPPGSSTVLGIPLLLIAPQLAIGARDLWLPAAIGRRGLKRTDLKRIFDKVLPRLAKLERLLEPRLDWVFGPVGDRLIGVVCTLLALVLILPIWGGNLLPALAICTLALGLTQRDGVLVVIGYGVVAASVALLAVSIKVVIASAGRLLHMLDGLNFA